MAATPRRARAGAPAQLEVTWRNYDGTATIYLDDGPDPGKPNLITIEVDNGVGGPVTLPAGTPAAYGTLPQGQSAVYAFFSGLVAAAEIAQARLSAEGWTAAAYTDADGLGYLAIAPDRETVLAAGGTLVFTLAGLAATGKPVSGYVTLAVSGAAGLSPAQSEVQILVQVKQRPVPSNQTLDLLVGFAGRAHVLTGADQDNSLVLYLTNPGPQPLAPGGSASWGPVPPTFQLGFVCGAGPGALTTAQAAAQISVGLGNTYGNVWKAVQRHSQGPTPYWTMQPSSNGGGQILGAGEQATVTFDITGIVTTLPQGLTYAYLSYTGIPGYNDGAVAIELLKAAPVVVTTLTAEPPSITRATAPVPVTLGFTVANAGYVAVANTPYAATVAGPTVSDQVTVEVSETTVFTVNATNPDTGVQTSRSIQVTVGDPSPTVHALTVETEATVAGDLTVTGGSTLGVVKASGRVTAPTAILNGALEINNGQISATFDSPTKPVVFIENDTAAANSAAGGGIAVVVPPGVAGVWTTGMVVSGRGSAPLTALPTSTGERVASSPLSVEPELHLSGSGRLTAGRAVVSWEPDLADLVHHTAHTPYRVLLTPTAHCNGLAVTGKEPGNFTVEELAAGESDATFDWLLIAHLRTAPGSPDRATLPTHLPPGPQD